MILFCVVWLVSCSPSYTYQIPEQTDDGWQTASLDAIGLSEKKFSELIKRINRNESQNIHSILIVKDGKLVFEEYFKSYTYDYEGDQFRGEYTEYGINTLHELQFLPKQM